MKTKDIVRRYVDVLGRLSNNKRATFDQLLHAIEAKDENLGITRRTFQRMIDDIDEIFRIRIKSDREGFYYIEHNQSEEDQIKLTQSFHFINYQKHFENYEKHIAFDSQCMVGQEYIYDIRTAIKECITVEIEYRKYTTKTEIEKRLIDPYGLKEYQGRWYIVGYDRDKNAKRTFGLDRIKGLKMSEMRFLMPKDFNIKDYFKNSIGTIVLEDETPELIELLFTPKLAGYVKNMPIHPSQKIEYEDHTGLIIRIRAHNSIELINELMIYSDDVRVLRPLKLKKALRKRAEQILENNKLED
ncbi:MAG: helix-turn-helix transcriptional regulator [Chitinophagales bacterium]